MIELQNISFAYGDELIIDKLNLEIAKGEAVAITGDNGCGKSTLMKILNGLYFPHSGTYTFEGDTVSKKSMSSPSFAKSFHAKIGYVFQNTDAQLFCSDVESEISFGIEQLALPPDEIKQRVQDIISMFELEKFLDRAPYTLSAGEKKRVAVASVLVTNPKVLILDEPLAGLDKKSRDFLTELLLRLKSSGKTIIYVTHEQSLVTTLADREINLDK